MVQTDNKQQNTKNVNRMVETMPYPPYRDTYVQKKEKKKKKTKQNILNIVCFSYIFRYFLIEFHSSGNG